MDYLLDKYVFDIMPFDVSQETRKSVGQRALTMVQWADWFCKYEHPGKILQNNPYFVAAELVFSFLCLLTLLHAYRHGARYLYVWVGITIHALTMEFLSLSVKDLNLSWHAQGVLSFFGMRVPLYAIFGIHQVFGYTAYVLVKRMHLPWWAEGPATGLTSVMLLLPYRLLGTKLLWFTWHDTDPTINDRMFWTPWSLLYFYAASVCSFVWVVRFSRNLLLDKEYDWVKFPREILCVVLAGLLSFWLGTLQFSLFYYPLHDFFGVHTEITTILFFGMYALIVYAADRNNPDVEARHGSRFWFDELSCAIALEYIFLMVLVVVADPLNIVSEGIHQPIGPCKQMEEVNSPAGLVLQRGKYLCATSYDEKYFDFHCVPNGIPKQQDDGTGKLLPLEYYAICGTDFVNRAEYVIVIWSCCIMFGFIAYQMAACSGSTPVDPVKVRRRAGRNSNTVTVPSSSNLSLDTQQREPLVSAKPNVLETPNARAGLMPAPYVPVITTTRKKAATSAPRRRNTDAPPTTRVLRSRSRRDTSEPQR